MYIIALKFEINNKLYVTIILMTSFKFNNNQNI